jgi:hypothetical protein
VERRRERKEDRSEGRIGAYVYENTYGIIDRIKGEFVCWRRGEDGEGMK